MNLYLETSAVLSWLLNEPEGPAIADLVGRATIRHASELTLVECRRTLSRLAQDTNLIERHLTALEADWSIIPLLPEILARAGRPFPVEPVRTLDALHLATALNLAEDFPDLHLLSLDERVRQNGQALGMHIVP